VKTTVDFEGGAVIVTGGTRGLGKAMGLEFSRAGATVVLTHRWSSVDEDELRAEFEAAALKAPHIIESDASDPAAARELMKHVASLDVPLVAVMSNVAFAQVVNDFSQLRRSSLELSLRYSTWPVLDLLHAAKEILDRYPRYVLAISTGGGITCHPGYDIVGVAKAALETLCRYLAVRLRDEGVRVNAVRCGLLDTDSARATFGDQVLDSDILRALGMIQDPTHVARACVALCSGLMDSVSGQVIEVDEGTSLLSPLSLLADLRRPGPVRTKVDGG
jgi:NAD(P)-dependent dehydrogenase (short-subunit alcohol dehydrogenase family)